MIFGILLILAGVFLLWFTFTGRWGTLVAAQYKKENPS